MPKQFKLIDSANYLVENYSPSQIDALKHLNIINPRVLLAIETKKIFDKQKSKSICEKYEFTAIEMNISMSYVRKLLNG